MRRATDIEYLKKFAQNVKTRRYSLGLSQERLAERIDCHPNHIGRIERGLTDPSLSMVLRIARALETTPHELIP